MLLNPAELGVSPEKLRAAEATVAALIGATSLEEREVAQAGFAGGSIIILQDGPLTELTTFLVNGWGMNPMVSPWFIRIPQGLTYAGLASYVATGAPYALTYKAGWTADNVPEAIREAVRQYATGEGAQGALIAEKLGDVENRYAAPTLSAGLSDLLAPWRPLRF